MRMNLSNCVRLVILSLSIFVAAIALTLQIAAADDQPQVVAADNPPSKLWSSEDGWLDIGGFVDQPYGFIPLVIPITEPAVGYGAALALAFIDKPKGETEAGFGRPNITAVGLLGTENGTKGGMAADVHNWLDDRLQTLFGVISSSVNLDFYGLGRDNQLAEYPLSYKLEISGGVAQAKYRFGRRSRLWGGLGYALAATKVGLSEPLTTSRSPDFQRKLNLGGLTPSITYDSRDNIFTPTAGAFLDVTAGLFSKVLGSDVAFQRLSLLGLYYLPLHPKLTLGIKGTTAFSFGDVPFYMRPFLAMRGAPVMRYQGEHVAQIEGELRWQFWQRFSLVGFGGTGTAWNDFRYFNRTVSVATGGAGFRYEIARKYGIHMGLDLAFGPDTKAIYLQVGSAWMRP